VAHVFWSVQADAVIVFAVAAGTLWLALIALRRRRVAGATGFAWMMLAVAVWVGLSGLHRILHSVDARILTAQFQYLGIASVGPLWLLFCRQYARRPAMAPGRNLALWIVPALTIAAVFSNHTHHQYWRDVVPVSANPADGVRYIYGPLFYLAAAYAYSLIALGTWHIVRSVRDRSGPFRRESVAMAAAATVPLVVNAMYLAKLTPDLTPMAFAASGGLFAWQFLRGHFLDLTPIARGLLFDRLSDAVFVLDPEYRILDANARARVLAGDDPPIGVKVSAVLPWWYSFIGGETRHPDGPSVVRAGARVFDVAVTPVTEAEGVLAGWLVVIRDITQRLRDEEERRALDRRLQEQQHTESLTLLAGGLAHDFNNVLAGIMGNADLLAMKLPLNATELRELTRTITVGSERAADLVAKMLAYSGQGAGPAVLIDMHAVTEEMVDLLRASVVRQGTLLHESSGPLPPVSGDATQVRQIVMNLIVNAADAVEARAGAPGTVIVRTAVDTLPHADAPVTPPLPPASLPPGRYVRIEVADTGVGMSDDTRTRMFDPFYSTKASGRGLGLASVQGIVRSHRGALAVHSVPDEGTTIRVWLPVAL
jgi:signal transduction histidine kinase